MTKYRNSSGTIMQFFNATPTSVTLIDEDGEKWCGMWSEFYKQWTRVNEQN